MIAAMNNLCDGSRRPVRGKRHQLETAGRNTTAVCPVCMDRLVVRSVLGQVEFPRHEAPKRNAR